MSGVRSMAKLTRFPGDAVGCVIGGVRQRRPAVAKVERLPPETCEIEYAPPGPAAMLERALTGSTCLVFVEQPVQVLARLRSRTLFRLDLVGTARQRGDGAHHGGYVGVVLIGGVVQVDVLRLRGQQDFRQVLAYYAFLRILDFGLVKASWIWQA